MIRTQKTEFGNTQRGHMIATSVGASATGRGGNFLLADDLINPAAGQFRRRARRARSGGSMKPFRTRLDDKRAGRHIVIEQRTHAADLTGHLLAQGGWTHVSLPAIAERRTVIIFPRSRREIVREEGDLLWPAREGRAELEAAKVSLGSFAFAAQYLQAPVSREGNLIKREWLTATYRAGCATAQVRLGSAVARYRFQNRHLERLLRDRRHRHSAQCRAADLRPAIICSTPGAARSSSVSSSASVVELHQTWHPHAVLDRGCGVGPEPDSGAARGHHTADKAD